MRSWMTRSRSAVPRGAPADALGGSRPALAAARLSLDLGIPMADSVMLATARAWGATFWTEDSDFAEIPEVRYVAKGDGKAG
jgi:predicted nucleic acid-binding protein